MVSASTQELLHASQNPSQSRTALDNAETRIAAVRSQHYERFTDIVNSDDAPDMHIIDMVPFNGITVDCSVLLGEPMTMLDVSTTMRDLKRDLSVLMSNFSKSGEGVNGTDMFDRDCEFYDRFCKGDAVLFAVYLAWDHGRNIPQWNSTLLPRDLQLDIGTNHSANAPSTAIKRPRGTDRGTDDIVNPKDLSKLVEMQTKFFDYALGGRGIGTNGSDQASSSSSSSSTQHVDRLSAMDTEIVALQRLRSDNSLTQEQRQKVDARYNSVIDRICYTTSDLTA
jgi:hypothetical protein